MVSKIFIVLGIIGVLTLLDILIFSLIAVSNNSNKIGDDEEQLKYIREYNEKRKLKNAKKMSRMQQ